APLALRIRADAAPARVLEGTPPIVAAASRADFDAAESAWFYEAETRTVLVHLRAQPGARTVSTERNL
ncbi:MAG: hypothetical protein JNM74_28315, partial [Myxococcales bacterium]|nr:hypothetical protein [Myxococcales bacterium]